MNNNKISLIKKHITSYPDVPFSPSEGYIEFKNFKLLGDSFDLNNKIYGMVRNLLQRLELDKKNINKENWNPFNNFIKKGNNVVIKPNLVFDRHPLKEEGILSMITHASIIRPIIDYILLAVGRDVNITICDVPLQSANWHKLIEIGGYKSLVNFYKKNGIVINLFDLRYEVALINKEGVCYKKNRKIRDPQGYISVNMGRKSYFQDIVKDCKKLEITDYKRGTVSRHHNFQKNEYCISKTILNADVFINVPKMKVHHKAGVTLSMKNLIGINGDKSWIAHHRKGVDEYPYFDFFPYFKWRFAYYLKLYFPNFIKIIIYRCYSKFLLRKKTINEVNMIYGASLMEGNWYGNDTLWRTILDLNNLLFFCDKKGIVSKIQKRKYLSIIDGIIGMEGDGPMTGSPKKSGILVSGFHPVVVDFVSSYVMGFDHNKIPQIREGLREKYFNLTPFNIKELSINSNVNWKEINLRFASSKGWQGNIER